jgi:hypothetical protein
MLPPRTNGGLLGARLTEQGGDRRRELACKRPSDREMVLGTYV